MILFWIAGAITVLAHKVWNSYFCKIMAGTLWITAGINRIIEDPGDWTYLMTGVIVIAIGVYEFIMVGIDLWKGE